MSQSSFVIECRGLEKSFVSGRSVRRILDGAEIAVAAGEWVAITGPSGVGKTTLLHVLAGILPPDSGSVLWHGDDLYGMPDDARDRKRASAAGIVFQFHHLLPDLSVLENVALARRLAGLAGSGEAESRALLDRLGLSEFTDARIEKLSGGERQRVAVARALAHGPKIIFADEPTGNLDERSAEGVLDLLSAAQSRDRIAIVMTTHNPRAAARAARTLHLTLGKIAG